jgi:predicted dehydrogenase
MNAAILGAGSAGLLHAMALRAHGVSVSLVFDPDGDRARALASMFGARVAVSVEEVASSAAEIVCVASPPNAHVSSALTCAREGRFVFIEKPVALSEGELARLLDTSRCVPIVQWRLGRGLRAIRRAIAEGLFGDAPTVAIDLAWQRDREYLDAKGSRDRWGCGALLSVGIHAVDAVCFALDRRALDVRGIFSTQRGLDVETSASALLGFEGGAHAALRLTFDAGSDRTRFSFTGGGMTAILKGTEADPTAAPVRWRGCPHSVERARLIERSVDGHSGPPLIVPYIGHCLDIIRRGRSPLFPALPHPRDVAESHRVVFRAYG